MSKSPDNNNQIELTGLKIQIGGKLFDLSLSDNPDLSIVDDMKAQLEQQLQTEQNNTKQLIASERDKHKLEISQLKQQYANILPTFNYDSEYLKLNISVYAYNEWYMFVLPFEYKPIKLVRGDKTWDISRKHSFHVKDMQMILFANKNYKFTGSRIIGPEGQTFRHYHAYDTNSLHLTDCLNGFSTNIKLDTPGNIMQVYDLVKTRYQTINCNSLLNKGLDGLPSLREYHNEDDFKKKFGKPTRTADKVFTTNGDDTTASNNPYLAWGGAIGYDGGI